MFKEMNITDTEYSGMIDANARGFKRRASGLDIDDLFRFIKAELNIKCYKDGKKKGWKEEILT